MSEKPPTFNQILDQDKDGNDPTVLIRRTDQSIQVARLTGDRDENGRFYAKFENGVKPVAVDHLSDDHQASLASELASTLPPYETDTQHEEKQETRREMGNAALQSMSGDPIADRLGEKPVSVEDTPIDSNNLKDRLGGVTDKPERKTDEKNYDVLRKEAINQYDRMCDILISALDDVARANNPQVLVGPVGAIMTQLYALESSLSRAHEPGKPNADLGMIDSAFQDIRHMLTPVVHAQREPQIANMAEVQDRVRYLQGNTLPAMIDLKQRLAR